MFFPFRVHVDGITTMVVCVVPEEVDVIRTSQYKESDGMVII